MAALTAVPDVLKPETLEAASTPLPGTTARPGAPPSDGPFLLLVAAAAVTACCAAAVVRLRRSSNGE